VRSGLQFQKRVRAWGVVKIIAGVRIVVLEASHAGLLRPAKSMPGSVGRGATSMKRKSPAEPGL